jgi:hypothetical protein
MNQFERQVLTIMRIAMKNESTYASCATWYTKGCRSGLNLCGISLVWNLRFVEESIENCDQQDSNNEKHNCHEDSALKLLLDAPIPNEYPQQTHRVRPTETMETPSSQDCDDTKREDDTHVISGSCSS